MSAKDKPKAAAPEATDLPWLDPLRQRLAAQLQQGKTPHALLLTGPAHSGLTELCQWLAGLLLCRQPTAEGACGQCRSCQLRQAGSHPDYVQLAPEEGSQVIKIDAIRALIHSLSLTPGFAPRKLATLIPAEALHPASANALLKTLEEPAGDAVLVLVCHRPQRLLPTILSRCQQFPVAAPERSAALDWLASRTDTPEKELHSALDAAGGQPLWALASLDGELLQQRQALARDLQALVRRQTSASEVASCWAEAPAALVWQWLAGWCAALARKQMVADAPVAGIHLDSRSLLDLQALALHRLRLSEAPLRQDLLLGEWLLQWSGARVEGSPDQPGNRPR